MIEAYKSVLKLIKAKFEKMRYAERSLSKAQEVQANIDLLEEIIRREISDLQAEKERLTNQELPKRKAKLKKKAVSDFSISKLALPQVSEGSNDAMEVDETKRAPPATDQ
ncbi:Uncharacterized protein Rs2_44709 [Raphanus sativus]|nr:Uncharacterized protein Rs2_44709 [Raphanus sativus]